LLLQYKNIIVDLLEKQLNESEAEKLELTKQKLKELLTRCKYCFIQWLLCSDNRSSSVLCQQQPLYLLAVFGLPYLQAKTFFSLANRGATNVV
jgi:hypothetical protein